MTIQINNQNHLYRVFPHLNTQELALCASLNRTYHPIASSTLAARIGKLERIRDGLIGATIIHCDAGHPPEKLFLRFQSMVNEEEANAWETYANDTLEQIRPGGGRLTGLVYFINRPYSNGGHKYGFTQEEYAQIQSKIIHQTQRQPKIVSYLQQVGGGVVGFSPRIEQVGGGVVGFSPRNHPLTFVTFLTKKYHFSIQKAVDQAHADKSFINPKKYLDAYQDLISCVATHLRHRDEGLVTVVRGTFKNPQFILFPRYSGTAMAIHSFNGRVLKEDFDDQSFVTISPTTVMARLLLTDLKKGEGYFINENNEKTDLKELVISKEDLEANIDIDIDLMIQPKALSRIFEEKIARMMQMQKS